MVEDEASSDGRSLATAWHGSVRLLHVYQPASESRSQQRFLGSFYLDPVARPAKLPRNVTSILYPPVAAGVSSFAAPDKNPNLSFSPVVMGMSLSMEHPGWEGDPVRMRWEDAVGFLHELGHVVDVLLLHSLDRLPLGAIVGHASLPADRSEILPKVR
jgi:Zn-dependent oligopeptidase